MNEQDIFNLLDKDGQNFLAQSMNERTNNFVCEYCGNTEFIEDFGDEKICTDCLSENASSDFMG